MVCALMTALVATLLTNPVLSRRAPPPSPARSEAAFAPARAEQLAARPELIDYDPVAAPAAVVTSGDKVRFTVLTDRVIRMEYAKASGAFEDHATIAIMNRALPVPAFTTAVSGGVLTITTAAVKLSYTVGSPFSAASLSVVSLNSSSAFTSWAYGTADVGNLLGTIRGLDGQDGTPLNCTQNSGGNDNGESLHCEWGMVSRDGWVIYDDSANFILDGNDWWVPDSTNASRTLPNGDAMDLYGFFHGHDYFGALADFVAISGKTIMVPRSLSGIWWSRW